VLALRSFRRFLLSVGLSAVLAALPVPRVLAQEQTATLRGAEDRNFGRLIFTLPSAQKVRARVANGVLIVSFAEPVSVSADRIVREMPAYVSVARLDPDARGMRLALTRNFKPNVMEAGEKTFIDLIPDNWQGMLPGLPLDVVEEMAERLRKAEMTARDLVRTRDQTAPRELEVRSATLPTLSRLVFEVPQNVNADAALKDGRLELNFRAPLALVQPKLRAVLPDGVKLVEAETAGGVLRLALTISDQYDVKTFREEDGFIVDLIDRKRAIRPSAEMTAPVTRVAAPKVEVVAKPAETAPTRPTASMPAPSPAAEQTAMAAEPANLPPQAVKFSAVAHDDGVRLDFQFPRRTAAAAFDEGGEIVIVFDTIDTIDAAELMASARPHLSNASALKEGKATVLRLQFSKPGLVRLAPDGMRWSLTTGDKGVQPTEALLARQAVDDRGQSIVRVPLAQVSGIHWIGMAAGQGLAVATAHAPGASMPKSQRFVEFQIEQTMQGVVIRPYADDVLVKIGTGEIQIGRGNGLVLSAIPEKAQASEGAAPADLIADRATWAEMRMGNPMQRLHDLTRKAAETPRSERSAARLRLAAFQLANGLDAEALGPIGTLLTDDPNMRNDRRAHLMRVIAQTMLLRNLDAEKTLALPTLKDDAEAALWQAVNDARFGRFPKALIGFRRGAEMVNAYPEQLQVLVRREIVNAALAMRDQALAEREITILASLAPTWLPRDEVELLRAQLDDMNGRTEAALLGYKSLFNSYHRGVAARAQLKGVQLADREKDKSISPDEALERLETVSFIWRGDDVEIEAIGELGSIYSGQKRWREAFALARKANSSFPDHPITRRLHDETAQQFEDLFTSGKADELPRVDALALFYDFKEFLPIGRRGDEITRRLADRLVEVDLLDQAAELLQHQIDNRVTGAARAIVATRLAMIRLLNAKPAEALRALSSTRLPELPRDVKRARQLLEAKALSDLSRTDLALEVLGAESGPEVDRLRSDILWTARRWREAGEAHERILGEAWRGPETLNERQRADTMRAAVAYVMADEVLSLDRLRAKYANPMSQTPDARTFAFITGANRARTGDLRELARNVANADTLTEFMSEYRKRYPDYASSLRKRLVEGEAKAEGKIEAPTPPKQAETAPAGGRPG
jgi:tetratricopeptide (TPR) repeat protein/cell division septation protein DedD